MAVHATILQETERHLVVKPTKLWFGHNANNATSVEFSGIPILTLSKQLIASVQKFE
jgi:hypothetical protein